MNYSKAARRGQERRGKALLTPASVPGPPVFRAPDAPRLWPWGYLVALFLMVATLVVFGRVGGYPFVDLDDNHIVYENPRVKDGFAAGSIQWALTDTHDDYWQPLSKLSHMLDCQLFGLQAGRHHLVNVLFHLFNTLLLFALLRYATGSLWRSAFVAALFALHPLRVESVAWVSERRDMLSGFFSILTLWTYVRYTERPVSWKRYLLFLVSFWLALMSKPMAITLPLVLLLFDYWPLGRWRQPGALRRLFWEKAPLFALTAVVSAITLHGMVGSGTTVSLAVLPIRLRIANAFVAYASYIGKIVWPHPLAVYYPYTVPTAAELIWAAFVLVLLTGIAVQRARRWPYLFVGWFWFFITLLPTSGLTQSGSQASADRFTYFALIGPLLALIWGGAEWLARKSWRRPASIALASIVLPLLGWLSWQQVGFWQNSETLYRHAIAVTKDNEFMYYELGGSLASEGRLEEATQCYREAVRLEPTRELNRLGLGDVLLRQGDMAGATQQFREAVRLRPDDVLALKKLSFALLRQGQTDEALARKLLALAPDDPEVQGFLQLATLMHPAKATEPIAEVKGEREAKPVVMPPPPLGWTTLSADEALETGILLGFLLLAVLWPNWGKRAFGRFDTLLARIARRPLRAMAAVALLPMVLRLLYLPIYPIPEPTIHDEFGYLLLADTFASGRLTNPPHPMRDHFESSYIIQSPSYTSYYPIGQGVVMALAKVWGLSPWFGIWLSIGAMCAALYWMLAGWMSGRWALLGALLAVVRLSVLSHWMNSYWGGAVAAIGGALVFGALPRIYRGKGAGHAVLLGLGFAILMQTRPYEGFLVSIPVGAALLIWLFRAKTMTLKLRFLHIVLPLAAVLMAAGAFTAYYNWRVTGNPLELPYQLYQKKYGVPQSFYWQPPLPPGDSVRFPDLEANYRWQLDSYNVRLSWWRMASVASEKLRSLWGFYVQPVWTLPFLVLPWLWRDRRLRFLLITTGIVITGVAMYPFFFPHYLAPVCGVFLLIVVEGIRRMRLWKWRNRPVGAAVARAVLVVSAMGLIIAPAGEHLLNGDRLVQEGTPRARILKTLEERGGKHLILVHYGPNHVFHYGLINNDADIDNSRVLWARDLGAARNQELVRYFRDRTAWFFDADQWPVRLVPYPRQGVSAASSTRIYWSPDFRPTNKLRFRRSR